jgi:hypothetical protein
MRIKVSSETMLASNLKGMDCGKSSTAKSVERGVEDDNREGKAGY